MNIKQLTTIGATGIGAFLVSKYTGERTNAPNGIPVRNGIMQWDERFERNTREGYIYDINGNAHEIGSYGAINAMYEVAAEYSLLTHRISRVVRQSLSNSQIRHLDSTFRTSGRFDLSQLTNSQQVMIQTMVNTFVNFGQALRLLSYIYQAAGLERMYRPSKWERRNVDLANIIYLSILNPLVTRTGPMTYQQRIMRVTRPVGWLYIGWDIIQSFVTAYDITVEGQQYLIEDIEEAGEELAEHPGSVQTMGAFPVVLVGKIITVIVIGLVTAYAIKRTLEAVSLFLGRNLQYAQMQADLYEEAVQCAMDPDRSQEERESCRLIAAQIAEDTESYTPGMGTGITALILGGLSLIGYYLYKRNK